MSVLITIGDDGSLSFNNKQFMRVPKFYLADDGRFRTQATIIMNDKQIYVDVVIYQFSFRKPQMIDIMKGNGCVTINIDGTELNSETDFDLGIIYNIKKSTYEFNGKCGKKIVNQTFSNLVEVFHYFYQLFII